MRAIDCNRSVWRFRVIRVLTRARITLALADLAMKSTAPAARPSSSSAVSLCEVTNTTGSIPGSCITLEPAANLVTVQSRHHHIQQNQVRQLILAERQGVLAAGGDKYLAVGLKHLIQQPYVQWLVIDDQKP